MRTLTKVGMGRPAVAVAAVLALLLAACGGDDNGNGEAQEPENQGREVVDEGAPQQGGSLVIGINAETNGWSPYYSQIADAGQIAMGGVYETLTRYNDQDEVEPWLLESYESNEDATEWTLTTREGITFHNGEPFDAEAVATNLNAAIDSPLTGLALQGHIERPEVVDERTLVVRTTNPYYTFPDFMATAAMLQAAPAMDAAEDKGVLEPIGTGPYQFDEWVQDSFVRVNAYPDYWANEDGEGPPYLDTIEFRVIVDAEQRANALETGELDMIFTVSPDTTAEFRTKDGYFTVEDNFQEETMILLNTAIPPFDNINARKALAYGTDQDRIVEILGEGVVRPVTSPYQEGTKYYVEDDGYPEYDPEMAEQFVEAYKEETGAESLAFTLQGLNQVDLLELTQVLEQLWEPLGIDAEIQTVEQTTYITQMAAGQFQANYLRNFGYRNPASQRVFWHSDYAGGVTEAGGDIKLSINFSQLQNPDLDAASDLLEQGATEEERRAANEEAVRIINEELPYIWLYSTPYALISREGIGGLNTPRQLGFAGFDPKPWIGGLYIQQ